MGGSAAEPPLPLCTHGWGAGGKGGRWAAGRDAGNPGETGWRTSLEVPPRRDARPDTEVFRRDRATLPGGTLGTPRGRGRPLGMLSTGVHGGTARWMVGWLTGHRALQKGRARFPEGMSLCLGSRWLVFPVGKACGTLGVPRGTRRSPGGTCRLGSSW